MLVIADMPAAEPAVEFMDKALLFKHVLSAHGPCSCLQALLHLLIQVWWQAFRACCWSTNAAHNLHSPSKNPLSQERKVHSDCCPSRALWASYNSEFSWLKFWTEWLRRLCSSIQQAALVAKRLTPQWKGKADNKNIAPLLSCCFEAASAVTFFICGLVLFAPPSCPSWAFSSICVLFCSN